MKSKLEPMGGAPADFRTVFIKETVWGFSVSEEAGRYDRETMAEALLRLVGLLTIIGGYAVWLMPPTTFVGNPTITAALLGILLSVAGVSLYVFARRGFRREIHLDRVKGQMRVLSLNAADQRRVMGTITLTDVSSIFVKRGATADQSARLCARVRGVRLPVVLLRGEAAELEHVHRTLCGLDQSQVETRRLRAVFGPRGASVPAFT